MPLLTILSRASGLDKFKEASLLELRQFFGVPSAAWRRLIKIFYGIGRATTVPSSSHKPLPAGLSPAEIFDCRERARTLAMEL